MINNEKLRVDSVHFLLDNVGEKRYTTPKHVCGCFVRNRKRECVSQQLSNILRV